MSPRVGILLAAWFVVCLLSAVIWLSRDGSEKFASSGLGLTTEQQLEGLATNHKSRNVRIGQRLRRLGRSRHRSGDYSLHALSSPQEEVAISAIESQYPDAFDRFRIRRPSTTELRKTMLYDMCEAHAPYETNTDYQGSDLQTGVTGINDAKQCCALCVATTGCKFFTFGTDVKKCWMKSSSSLHEVQQHRTSGAVAQWTDPPTPLPSISPSRPPSAAAVHVAKSTSTFTSTSTTTWIVVLSKGTYGTHDVGAAAFNALFHASVEPIIKRLCLSCSAEYREIYYRRYTAPADFEPYDYFKTTWSSTKNALNQDFGIFSTYEDALAKTNPWQYCNFDDAGVGFPRDCGKTGPAHGQWAAFSPSSYSSQGAQDVAYYILPGVTSAPIGATNGTAYVTPEQLSAALKLLAKNLIHYIDLKFSTVHDDMPGYLASLKSDLKHYVAEQVGVLVSQHMDSGSLQDIKQHLYDAVNKKVAAAARSVNSAATSPNPSAKISVRPLPHDHPLYKDHEKLEGDKASAEYMINGMSGVLGPNGDGNDPHGHSAKAMIPNRITSVKHTREDGTPAKCDPLAGWGFGFC